MSGHSGRRRPARLARLADASYRHRRAVAGTWGFLLIAVLSSARVGAIVDDFGLLVLACAGALGVAMAMLAAGTVRADRAPKLSQASRPFGNRSPPPQSARALDHIRGAPDPRPPLRTVPLHVDHPTSDESHPRACELTIDGTNDPAH
jgi:hypothetical protein